MMWTALTQYRCDAAIASLNHVWLIELKPVLTHAIIGQLIAYRDAMTMTPLDSPDVTLVGLAQDGNPHVEAIAARLGIKLATITDESSMIEIFGTLLH
jgi:hypothetical protein